MNPIAIIIPTLDEILGRDVGRLAKITSGCVAPVRVVVSHDKQRQGFTKTVNEGINLTHTDEDICLLNDDVFGFQYGWLEILRRVLYSGPRYGIVCPSGKCASSPMRTGSPGQFGVQVVKMLSFWCVLLRREVFNKVGLLDEAFIHYGSDSWYCREVCKAGWQLVWAKAVFLKHRHGGSGCPLEWQRHDQAIYRSRKRK